jgi:glycosyltransferase involved in cell wall biosynthesis
MYILAGAKVGRRAPMRLQRVIADDVHPQESTAEPRAAPLKRIAILPAFNEQHVIGRLIDEIRAVDPDLTILVVDDGSTDRTSAEARTRGVEVLRLPFNLGIGGAVQTGYLYALQNGFEIAVQIDGDGQHDPTQLDGLLAPILAGEADMVVGSRFADGRHEAGRSRRVGMRLLATLVSLLARKRVTDTTSGFRALNRRAIALFAADYPYDFPEVEAVLMAIRQRLRLCEVPVKMRRRETGRSSITAARSVYYMAKVTVALFVGLFRRNVVPQEDS